MFPLRDVARILNGEDGCTETLPGTTDRVKRGPIRGACYEVQDLLVGVSVGVGVSVDVGVGVGVGVSVGVNVSISCSALQNRNLLNRCRCSFTFLIP